MSSAKLAKAAIDLLATLPGCNWRDPETGRACRRPAYHRELVGRGRYCREHGERAGREGLVPIGWAGPAERLHELVERTHILTPLARDVVRKIATPEAGGLIMRVPDSTYWTTRDTPLDARNVPSWSTSTDMVRRLTRSGYLATTDCRCLRVTAPRGWLLRVLTQSGRNMARELERLDRARQR